MYVFTIDITEVVKSILQFSAIILAAYIGATIASNNVVKQLRHNNKTRFHERRNQAYSEFVSLSTDVLVKIHHYYEQIKNKQEERMSVEVGEELMEVTKIYNEIKLISSGNVRNKADEIYHAVSGDFRKTINGKDFDPEKSRNDMRDKISEFIEEAREEINGENY